MIVGKFGNEMFYVDSQRGIYTPSDLSFEYGKAIETQSTAGSKPISYIGDVNLIKSSFKLRLDNRFVDVQKKINTWKSMAEGKGLYIYYLGGRFISTNMFVVTSVKESNIKMNMQGVKISTDLDISVEEYAGNQNSKELNTKPLESYE